MNRLNMEDFYDWHPMVEMAGTMISMVDGMKSVRLTAKLDFSDETIDYVITFRDADGEYTSEYDSLESAIWYFNKKIEGE